MELPQQIGNFGSVLDALADGLRLLVLGISREALGSLCLRIFRVLDQRLRLAAADLLIDFLGHGWDRIKNSILFRYYWA